MSSFDQFDDEFENVPAAGSGKGPETLKDGDYVFEVLEASRKEIKPSTKSKGGFIVKLKLGIVIDTENNQDQEQQTVNLDRWVTDDDGWARVKRDLITMGFDVDEWKKSNGRPISQELAKALAAARGVRILARKVTNDVESKETGKTKTFHNIYINKRGKDDRPAKFTADDLNKAAEEMAEAEFPFGASA